MPITGKGNAPFNSGWLISTTQLYRRIQHGSDEAAASLAWSDWLFDAAAVVVPSINLVVRGTLSARKKGVPGPYERTRAVLSLEAEPSPPSDAPDLVVRAKIERLKKRLLGPYDRSRSILPLDAEPPPSDAPDLVIRARRPKTLVTLPRSRFVLPFEAETPSPPSDAPDLVVRAKKTDYPRRPRAASERTRLYEGGQAGSIEPGPLTTFAPNTLPLTGFFNAHIFEIARDNAAALVLGMTGSNHNSDLTVAVGHRHDTSTARLPWRALAQWTFVCNGESLFPPGVGTAPDEAFDSIILNSGFTVTLLFARFWAAPVDLVAAIPRIRVSNDNSVTVTSSITFEFYNPTTLALLASQTIVFTTAIARNRDWIDGVAIDLSGGTADPDQPARIPLIVKILGLQIPASEKVALHEAQIGVTP